MSEREEKGGGCAIGCVLMLVLLPVLYVLSIGPVVWLVKGNLVNGNESLRWIAVIYLPLELLGNSCGPFDDAIRWYIKLWTG